jgi:putative methyltransferase (TIGR04325 family)
MTIKEFAKLLTPPILIHGYHALRNRMGINDSTSDEDQTNRGLRLTGDYLSWEPAMADSAGYNAEIILEKTKSALLKVKNGEAVYERDSVVFDEIQYSWSLLSGLMWAAACSDGRLNVLDFGGSLGSTYFQNRVFLAGLREVRWNIVEQERQVEVGQKWFEDDQLKFYTNIASCLAATKPQVILLGSVLQYLPDPYEILDQLLNLPCEFLVIDRTPFWNGSNDRLCVQNVPAEIYPASYPSWIFSTERFYSHLNVKWEIIAKFDNSDQLPGPV